jgi:hypothetical protein
MDLLFVLLTIAFFTSCWGLLRLCEALMRGES